MNAPQKGPYSAEDPRTLIWLAGFSKGEQAGMDAGAKIVSDVYDRAILGGAA